MEGDFGEMGGMKEGVFEGEMVFFGVPGVGDGEGLEGCELGFDEGESFHGCGGRV